MHTKWIQGVMSAFAICMTSACSEALVACSGTGQFPIRAIVTDSVSGKRIAVGSRLIVHYGFQVDTIIGTGVAGDPSLDSTIYGGPEDVAGNFAVKVERARYSTWTNESVVVQQTSNRCGSLELQPVTLNVLLQPLW